MPIYEITCNPSYAKMFVVMEKKGDCWEQRGHRYFYKKNAEKFLTKLEAQEK